MKYTVLLFTHKQSTKFAKVNILKKTFRHTRYEERKKIMEHILTEIVMQVILEKLGNKRTLIESYQTHYPLIDHKFMKSNGKIQMTFDQETPLNKVIEYAKGVLELKNNPKKRKLSLGKSLRIMMCDNLIRESIDEIDEPFTYIEELTRKDYNEKYKSIYRSSRRH